MLFGFHIHHINELVAGDPSRVLGILVEESKEQESNFNTSLSNSVYRE
jgi:hypothetical protein